jgi:MFS family permease
VEWQSVQHSIPPAYPRTRPPGKVNAARSAWPAARTRCHTDLVWVALPIWQAEFGLSYAAVGLLRRVDSGTLASLQIPAAALAARIGAATVLAVGTALAGLCYCLAGISSGFAFLVLGLLLGGIGAATQHPIASALVTRTFGGAQSLRCSGPKILRATLAKS